MKKIIKNGLPTRRGRILRDRWNCHQTATKKAETLEPIQTPFPAAFSSVQLHSTDACVLLLLLTVKQDSTNDKKGRAMA
jgi:hypothetical protein